MGGGSLPPLCVNDSILSVCSGSDQSIQHYRTHHSTKSEGGQFEWEVVRVMRITTYDYDVHDIDQIPRTLFMIYCLCLYLYTANNPVPFVLCVHITIICDKYCNNNH